MQYHNQLIVIKGIIILLENEGPGFERDGLRTCRSLKGWIAQVFAECDPDSDYTVIKRKLEVWTALTDDESSKVDQSIQRHLAHVARVQFDHFLAELTPVDLAEVFWNAIEEEVERQTKNAILLGGNQ